MPTIDQIKEQNLTATPLFLFDCILRDGTVQRWASHAVTFSGDAYEPRLTAHNAFEAAAASSDGLDGVARISVSLANADSFYSQVERNPGFKGSRLTVNFVFFDLRLGTPASESRIVFRGIGNVAEEVTESLLRVTFSNQMSLQRSVLPEVRIGRHCPWAFPSSAAQRQEALNGGGSGPYSALFRCGYSADLVGGRGNLVSGAPFTSCNFTRANCVERGMFEADELDRPTGRFGKACLLPTRA